MEAIGILIVKFTSKEEMWYFVDQMDFHIIVEVD